MSTLLLFPKDESCPVSIYKIVWAIIIWTIIEIEKWGEYMKKIVLGTFTAVLTTGLLFGCGTPNDEQEPDPTEEPSEQQNNQNQNDSENDHQENNH